MRFDRWFGQIDWLLVAASLGLVAIGVLAIDTATDSASGTGPVQRQLVWTGIALVAMAAAAWPSYRLIYSLAYLAFVLCIPLLVAVYWIEPVNGAQRWLRFGPVGVQPSELTKLAFVAALARYLASTEHRWGWRMLFVPFALAGVPIALILRQPDLGSALLFVPVMTAMLFGAGLRTRYWCILLIAGIVAVPFLWRGMSPFQRARITSFLEQRDTGPRPNDEGYQLHQSKLMIALGGTKGSEDATDLHLPFDHTDFIFSVVAGRWGLTGVTMILGLFVVLFWRGWRVSSQAPDSFGRLLAMGLTTLLATQSLVNLAMTIGLAPITGLTLPFVSYGGSSLLTSFLAVGILLSIERQRRATWPENMIDGVHDYSLAFTAR